MNIPPLTRSTLAALSGACTQSSWYAGYTHPKAEKKVYDKIRQMGLEAFLPLHEVVRQWSDRKKKMEAPLFPNYVFVKTAATRRFDLLQIQELTKFVSCDNQPVPIPEKVITDIRKLMTGQIEVHDADFNYQKGDKVKVVRGLFTGTEGFLIRVGSKQRLIVEIQVLRKLVSVEVDARYVAPLA